MSDKNKVCELLLLLSLAKVIKIIAHENHWDQF